MRRLFCLAVLAIGMVQLSHAQGLRYSVCVVEPEYSEAERELMADYALYMARAGMTHVARTLTVYKNEDCFGSGVVVEHGNKKYVLTNMHVVGYARQATVVFQLHEQTIRYSHCAVVKMSATDLAAIELPEESEMIALPISNSEIEEDMSIVAAGFPGLGNKPSWQLTRGIVSNARVSLDNHEQATRIIQHTASIDPGSSGGPLLLKNGEGKYEILGINTWKAFYREGVGLAIGKEDVQAFWATFSNQESGISAEYEALRSLSGVDWLYAFRHLPEEKQRSIREMEWQLPFEPALRVLSVRDSLVAEKVRSANHYDRTAPHVITDMGNTSNAQLVYNNFWGVNQQVSFLLGHDWAGFVKTGVQVEAVIAQAPTTGMSSTYWGPLFGVYIGVQVPIEMKGFVLMPYATQSAAGGAILSGRSMESFVATTDTRLGVNWQFPFGKDDLIVGVHYDLDWLWTPVELAKKPTKTISGSKTINQFFQNGLGISIGIAW
ncbi:MAG: serine protease [Paludibacteraceae bacterium]|nr:serine protease [Paludibacteraceae bacterium]